MTKDFNKLSACRISVEKLFCPCLVNITQLLMYTLYVNLSTSLNEDMTTMARLLIQSRELSICF